MISKVKDTINYSDFTNKYLRSQIQYLFLLMLVSLIPFTIKFLLSFTAIVKSLKEANPSYRWPPNSDFLKSSIVSLLLLISSYLFQFLFTSILGTLISKKYKGQDREFRIEKLVNCVFKQGYYIFSVCFGYYVAKDCDFLSPNLGGKGKSINVFKGYPYQNLENYEEIKLYLVIQQGYHLFSLIQHLLKKPKNDYIEMLLHHLMTVALVSLAYFMNYVAISVIILIVHDCSDVFGYIVRIFVDTDYKKITLSGYIGLLISWFYMRLYVFPLDIILNAFYLNPTILDLNGSVLLGAMLHCLVVLHMYWFYLFIQMGVRFIRTKSTQDTYHVE